MKYKYKVLLIHKRWYIYRFQIQNISISINICIRVTLLGATQELFLSPYFSYNFNMVASRNHFLLERPSMRHKIFAPFRSIASFRREQVISHIFNDISFINKFWVLIMSIFCVANFSSVSFVFNDIHIRILVKNLLEDRERDAHFLTDCFLGYLITSN
jgi:hypothetical protein